VRDAPHTTHTFADTTHTFADTTHTFADFRGSMSLIFRHLLLCKLSLSAFKRILKRVIRESIDGRGVVACRYPLPLGATRGAHCHQVGRGSRP